MYKVKFSEIRIISERTKNGNSLSAFFELIDDDMYVFTIEIEFMQVDMFLQDDKNKEKQKEIEKLLLIKSMEVLSEKMSHLVKMIPPIPHKKQSNYRKWYKDVYDPINFDKLPKNCKYRSRGAYGDLCDIDDLKLASNPICNSCPIPDSTYLCDNFKNPHIRQVVAETVKKNISYALCNKNNEAHIWDLCMPGGNDCWEKTFDIDFSTNKVINISEEIHALNLAFHSKHGCKLITPQNPSSISALTKKVKTQEEFIVLSQSIGCIIDDINRCDKLKDSKQKGSINKLMEFFNTKKVFYDINSIAVLKNIAESRNMFPKHSFSPSALLALNALGIEHPISDPNTAAEILLKKFNDALIDLRISLEKGLE